MAPLSLFTVPAEGESLCDPVSGGVLAPGSLAVRSEGACYEVETLRRIMRDVQEPYWNKDPLTQQPFGEADRALLGMQPLTAGREARTLEGNGDVIVRTYGHADGRAMIRTVLVMHMAVCAHELAACHRGTERSARRLRRALQAVGLFTMHEAVHTRSALYRSSAADVAWAAVCHLAAAQGCGAKEHEVAGAWRCILRRTQRGVGAWRGEWEDLRREVVARASKERVALPSAAMMPAATLAQLI